MQWENLTVGDFTQAVKESETCVIALGVLEKHSEHLPLGTDVLNGHKIACMAAEKEPAVVFPQFYFGQIYEAKHFPGTFTIRPELLTELMLEVFDEIGRNGFKKIILYIAHGGNRAMAQFLAQCTLSKRRPYTVYMYTGEMTQERRDRWGELCETSLHGHACECETSISLANHEQLVKMERVPQEPGDPLRRMQSVPSCFSGIGWYSSFPDHYAGDASSATKEKGIQFREIAVDSLADFIKAVKNDKAGPDLSKEFFDRAEDVGK